MRPRLASWCISFLGIVAAADARADDEPAALPPPEASPSAARSAPPAYGTAPEDVRVAPPAYTYEPLPKPPALGRRGFQMAVRSGIAIPLGSFRARGDTGIVGGSADASDLVGPQLPLTLDLGAKVTKWIFVGGYLSFGAGLAAGDLSSSCDALRLDCRSLTFRIGAQVSYAIAPDGWINPWLGYGLGYSSVTVGDDGAGVTYRGFDFGHFMAGLDLRLSRTFGSAHSSTSPSGSMLPGRSRPAGGRSTETSPDAHSTIG